MTKRATSPIVVERAETTWLVAIADPVRLQIVCSLSHVTDATVSELAMLTQASCQTLRRHLDALEANGVIESSPGWGDGETPGRPAARFGLLPGVRESVRAMLDKP